MRRLIVLVACFVLIFTACAFAADGLSTERAKAKPSKEVTSKPPKETLVSITGVVKEISDTMITVERIVREVRKPYNLFCINQLNKLMSVIK